MSERFCHVCGKAFAKEHENEDDSHIVGISALFVSSDQKVDFTALGHPTQLLLHVRCLLEVAGTEWLPRVNKPHGQITPADLSYEEVCKRALKNR